jgi:DNA-binding YbaB/EbfC family protein
MRDIMGLMKQAQEMQQKMQDLQAELDAVEVEGSAGGGMVTTRVSGKGHLKAVSIDPSLLKPDEREILEDLIVAAMNDARTKAERTMQERMEEVTKGLPLPPGLKLF